MRVPAVHTGNKKHSSEGMGWAQGNAAAIGSQHLIFKKKGGFALLVCLIL